MRQRHQRRRTREPAAQTAEAARREPLAEYVGCCCYCAPKRDAAEAGVGEAVNAVAVARPSASVPPPPAALRV